MAYMGIDPGMSGGIAIVRRGSTEAMKMPQTETDINAAFSNDDHDIDFAVIEKVHSMPDQGVSSSFKFGMNYGFLRAMLIAHKIPFEEVNPRDWQKALGIPPRQKKPTEESHVDFKNRLKARAQQLFPYQRVTLATCDALLIAEFCRRVHDQQRTIEAIADMQKGWGDL